MVTDDDVKKLKKIFATKDDLDRYATKSELREMKDDIMDEMAKWHSKIFNLVDGLASEIKDGRDSRKIFSYRIEDHEARIKDLEKKSCVA